ncbi:MAG: hypothetical protein ABIK53_01070 [bacterium]
MKYAIGYQLPEEEEEPIVDVVCDFHEHIEEVYFPWLDIPTCRASLTSCRGYVNWEGQERLEHDLKKFRQLGIKLDILFNANCYGKYSVSQYLANLVCSILEHLGETVGGVDIVTTTSPAIAHVIKQNFKNIEVRASVNMRIGTVKGMEYISHLFDSFYLQREFNRDFERIKELKEWTDHNGKKLLMLANSGCLNFCSGQVFHDNLVAHETEIDETINIPEWTLHVCWNYFKNRGNWLAILQGSWVRPEDIHYYEPYFPIIKLATRMHSHPRMVVQSYIERKFYGNLLDLLEPGFASAFVPYILDNVKFPESWFTKTSNCKKDCHKCEYCNYVFEQVLTKME